jgi:heme A synthase
LRRHNGKSFLTRPATLALTLLLVQLFLGVAAYITRLHSPSDPQPLNPMVGITVAHVACGALVFATSIVLTLRVFKVLPGPVHEFELVPRAQARSLDSFQTPAGMLR